MNFDIEKDTAYITRLVETQYGRSPMSIRPVNMSFAELQANIFPGRHLFFGTLDLSMAVLNGHSGVTFLSWYTKLNGVVKFTFFPGSFAQPYTLMFDDLYSNTVISTAYNDFSDGAFVATERSIKDYATGSAIQQAYKLPFLSFTGYMVNVGG